MAPVFSGEEALAQLKEEPRRFDIVLLDEQMPGMDGLTTLEEIKGMLPDLPVVMVTKSEEEQVMETALGMKIDGYLTKPVNPSQILSVCKAILDSPKFISTQVTQRFVRDYSENRSMLSRDMQVSDWARLAYNLSSWDIELEKVDNEGLRQNHAGQKFDCNSAFSRFVADNYVQWLGGSGRPPLLSPSVIPAVLGPLLNSGKNLCLVVLDCMRIDQYLVIESLLKRYFDCERSSYYSIVPTAPRYARAALLGGAFPGELSGEFPRIFDESVEDERMDCDADAALLERSLRACNFDFRADGEYVHIGSSSDATEFLSRMGAAAERKLTVLAIDFFHTLTHGRPLSTVLQGITADESSLRALTLSWLQFSPLMQVFRAMANQDTTVVLTTGHGSTLCSRGLELYGAQGLKRHARYQFGKRVTSDERRCLYVSKPSQFRLPDADDGTVCLLAVENCYFSEPRDTDGRPEQSRNSFCYGGISMEEMIAPLAVLTPRTV